MATVNALSVALFNAAAGGYAADMTKNPAAYAAVAGTVLQKDLSTDAAFIDNVLGNFGITSTTGVYAEAKAAMLGMVASQGRAGAVVAAIDFLNGVPVSSPYAAVANAFAAKVAAATAFSSANSKELDVTKLISAVTGVDTDQVAIDTAVKAAQDKAAADLKAAQDKAAADAAAAKAAADAAAADAAAKAAADLKAANDKIAVIDDTAYASESAAAAAAKADAEAAAATAAAAAKAAADAAAAKAAAELAAVQAELATAKAEIIALKNPAGGDFLLTTSTETVVGNAGNDVITGTSTTYGAGDVIIDTNTTDADVLNLNITSDIAATASVTGIEAVNVNFTGFTATDTELDFAADNISATNLSFDLSGTTAVRTLEATGLRTGMTVTVSSDFASDINLTAVDNAVLSVKTSATTTTGTSNVDVTAATGALTSLTVVESTGSVDVDVTAGDLDGTISVTAAQDVNVTADTAESATIEAGDDVVIADLSAAETVTIVAGDDVSDDAGALAAVESLTVTAGGQVVLDTIGSSLTEITVAALGTYSAVSDLNQRSTITGAGIETANLSGNGGAVAYLLTGSDALKEINVTGTNAVTVYLDADDIDGLTANKMTLTNADAATVTVSLADTGATANDIDLSAIDSGAALILTSDTVHDLTIASGSTVTVKANQTSLEFDGVTSSGATNSLSIVVDATTANTTHTVTALTFTDLKTVSLDRSVDAADIALGTITGSEQNTNLTISIGANDVTSTTAIDIGTGTLTITGSGDVDLGSAVTAGSLDASAVTGNVTLDSDGTEVSIITTGEGDDTIETTAAADFVITAGDGDDTVTIDNSDNTGETIVVDGGNGDDTLVLGAGASINASTISVLGFETISMAGNATVRDTQLSGITADVVSTGGGTETLTIGVSQSVNDFSDLDVDSTVDSVVIDASARTAAATITGTNGADTITTSSQQRALADTVTAGSGDDTVNIGQGGDTATGGSGTDTLNVSGMYGSDGLDVEDGSSDAYGIVVNTTASAISGATIASNMAGTQYISKSITEIAAGKAAYLFSTDSTSNSSVVATFSGFENVTGSAGADYIVGNSSANSITGAAGDDYIDVGSSDSSSDTVVFSLFSSNGTDTIKGFDTTEDNLDLDSIFTGGTDVVAVTDIAAAGGEADFIDNEVYVFADGATAVATGSDVITVYTNLTQVAAFLSENLTVSTVGASNDQVAGDEAVFVINDLVADLTYVYHFKASANGDASAGDTISDAELTLVGIVTEESGAALVAADVA